MDPPPPPPSTTIPTTTPPPHSHSLPPLPTTKHRLMVSFNGHILPRPQTKSLCYAAGETRIVAVDRRTTAATFLALTHHLSTTLYNNKPFTLKYQLPNEDLDSLITISSDEDLENMFEEHDRVGLGGGGARIRLFLFPGRGGGSGGLLGDAKSETWFSDALKSSGLECEGNGGGESGDSGSGGKCESIVLETCSSFGSINSSVSGLGLVGNEDGGDKKVKVAVPSVESDNSARMYQDQVIPESESIIYNPSSMVHMQRNPQLSGYQMQQIFDQRQQPVQYIQTGSPHYIQYPTGPSPIPSYSSYYPMYMPYHQQQQQPNQPYPIYVMPVGPTDQSYNMSAPTHVTNSHVAYKEVMVPQPAPERAAVAPQPIPLSQAVGPTATPTPTYENEFDNDLAYAQIYKSQSSVPVFPTPEFEAMTKVEPTPLSDSSQ